MFLGLLLTFWTASWLGFGAELGATRLSRPDMPSPTEVPSTTWLVSVMLTTCAMLLLTRQRASIRRFDWAPVIGTAWTWAWTAVFASLFHGFEFVTTDDHCAYSSCWPAGYQDAAVAGPFLIASLVMIVLATAGARLPWWARALPPALIYLALTVVQLAAWERWVVPFFDGPPPFGS